MLVVYPNVLPLIHPIFSITQSSIIFAILESATTTIVPTIPPMIPTSFIADGVDKIPIPTNDLNVFANASVLVNFTYVFSDALILASLTSNVNSV